MKFRNALLATIVTALVAGSVHAQTLRVTIRKAPIRSGPGSQETRVATAMEGDLLEYIDADGLWYIVRVPGTQQMGYVHSALVERTSQGAPATTQRAPARTTAPPPPMTQPSASPPPAREREPMPNTQQPSSYSTTYDDAPWDHRSFGIGTRMGHSILGMAFNLRSWGNTAGLSFDVAGDEFLWQFQPSLMFKIGQPIELEAVYFQPYFGVGADMLWYRFDTVDSNFDVGVVALGGMDLGFSAVPNLTVSVDLGYISDPISTDCRSDCFTSNLSDKLGLNFGVNWYFK